MIFDKNEKTKIIFNQSASPSFNLAAEEVLFKRRAESFIMLWRNSPSIILGRNQNAYAELDMDYVKDNGIAVIRRLTGGGAVFHDPGNLNFTFIRPGSGMANFRDFSLPVVGYLRSLGLNAEFSGRNDILIGGSKVSGCAQASSGGRQLVHGTLLFSVDISALSKALKPNPLKLKSKGVASVRSRVANIAELLGGEMTVEQFAAGLYDALIRQGECEEYELTDDDIKEIEALGARKYSQSSWNIGAAPSYAIERTARIGSSLVTAHFNVSAGRLTQVKLFGDFFGEYEISLLEKELVGLEHAGEKIKNALASVPLEKFIGTADKKAFAALFD